MNRKYKYCFNDGKLVEFNEHCSEKTALKVIVNEIISQDNKCRVLTNTGSIYKEANGFFSTLPASLIALDLSTKKFTEFIKIIESVVVYAMNVCSKLNDQNQKHCENINAGTEFILNNLKEINTLR